MSVSENLKYKKKLFVLHICLHLFFAFFANFVVFCAFLYLKDALAIISFAPPSRCDVFVCVYVLHIVCMYVCLFVGLFYRRCVIDQCVHVFTQW